MSGMSPSAKIAAARLWATKACPYFTQALLSLIPKQVPLGTLSPVGTMGVSPGAILFWEAEAIERWTVPQLGTVLLHEIGHLLRDHSGRCKAQAADGVLFNLAGDAEINDDLVKINGAQLPDQPVMPASFGCKDGQTAEEYYAKLRQQASKLAGGSMEALSNAQSKGKGGNAGDPKPGPGRGWCGGGGGHKLPNEPDEGAGSPSKRPDEAAGQGSGGATSGPQPRSAADLENLRRATAEAIKSHEQQHGIGSVPGGWSRWSDGKLKPARVHWSKHLARASRAAVAWCAGATDYKYNRPSRRQSGIGFGPGRPVLPALVARVPEVAIAVDTSGSMGEEDILRCLSESSAVIRAAGGKVVFLACDCAVHEQKPVRSIAELMPLLKGGGGTSFVPIFEALEARPKRPDVVVVCTDGGGEAPAIAPTWCKTIWLLVGDHQQKPIVRGAQGYGECSWGEFIHVRED